MLARKSLSRQKIILLSGLLIVIWSIIGVVVYRYFGLAKPAGYQSEATLTTPAPSEINKTESQNVSPSTKEELDGIGLEILRDKNFTDLMIFGEVPLEVKVLGRVNPFSLVNP